MSPAERNELLLLNQRLYGGPLDNEPGDIVTLKNDVAEIKKQVNRASGALIAASAIFSFLGLTGIVALLRGMGI